MDIKVEGLNKSYSNLKVLNNFSNIFKDKEVSFIMGASGVGKTTLLKILSGLENADDGKIVGLDNKKISVVLQEDSLCNNLSILANIKIVCKNLNTDEVDSNLKKLGLEGCLYKRVSELSGGMKRRVTILRAIMYGFDVLIMDEPFKGLDKATKENVIKFIKAYIKDKTVIIVTHEIENIDYFPNSNVLYMSNK